MPASPAPPPPLHLAYPPLPGPGRSPRAPPPASASTTWRRRPRARRRRGALAASERPAMLVERAADGNVSASPSCSTPGCCREERPGRAAVRRRGGGPDREGSLRALRRGGLRGLPPRPPPARLVGSQRARHRPRSADGSARRLRLGDSIRGHRSIGCRLPSVPRTTFFPPLQLLADGQEGKAQGGGGLRGHQPAGVLSLQPARAAGAGCRAGRDPRPNRLRNGER